MKTSSYQLQAPEGWVVLLLVLPPLLLLLLLVCTIHPVV
jgi:hypothetical protein